MKKWIALLLVLSFALAMAGCNKAATPEENVAVAVKADYPAAIMVDDVIYYLSAAIPAEVDESAIIGYTTSYTDEMPQANGETNFNRELDMPYAKVENGIVVLNYDNEITRNCAKEVVGKVVFFSSKEKLENGFIVDNKMSIDETKEYFDRVSQKINEIKSITTI